MSLSLPHIFGSKESNRLVDNIRLSARSGRGERISASQRMGWANDFKYNLQPEKDRREGSLLVADGRPIESWIKLGPNQPLDLRNPHTLPTLVSIHQLRKPFPSHVLERWHGSWRQDAQSRTQGRQEIPPG